MATIENSVKYTDIFYESARYSLQPAGYAPSAHF